MFKIIKKFFAKKKKVVEPTIRSIGDPEFQRLIKDLKKGETGYTVPWAYKPKTKELNLNMTVRSFPEGTVCMPVTKSARGFVVNLNFDFFWEKYKF